MRLKCASSSSPKSIGLRGIRPNGQLAQMDVRHIRTEEDNRLVQVNEFELNFKRVLKEKGSGDE